MSQITLPPIRRPFRGVVTPPGSKSLTNRALVLASLAGGVSTIRNVLLAEDTRVMLAGLAGLGIELEVETDQSLVRVRGAGGEIPARGGEIHCGNSGTTMRFLTAVCTLGRGEFVLDGVPRMRQRPIGQLVDILKNLGARIEYLQSPGTPPIRVTARGLPGGLARFGRAHSSQFLSAVIQVAPRAKHEVQIELESGQTSWPYVAMTMRLLDHFGIVCELTRNPKTGQPRQINVPLGTLMAQDYLVEPDASSASYFLAAAAINEGSRVTIAGLGTKSLQGDVRLAELLARMGAHVKASTDAITVEGTGLLEGIDVDLSDMPDMAQTLAVVCLFADGESRLRGLHTLVHKETDRLAALRKELSKLGAAAAIEGDTLTIHPPDHVRAAAIDTYDDHRMAMSFAVASTRVNGLIIRDPDCVAKTYPAFFDDFRRVTENAAPA